MLVFLQALLASKKHKGEQEVTALLQEAAELHFSNVQGLPLSPQYLEKLDPPFLVCIAKEYLQFCPKQVRGGSTLPVLCHQAVVRGSAKEPSVFHTRVCRMQDAGPLWVVLMQTLTSW